MEDSREILLERLKSRAGLTDEQARRAVAIFEEYLRERGLADREEFRGLLGGSLGLFEERE